MKEIINSLNNYFDQWGTILTIPDFLSEIQDIFSKSFFSRENSRLVFSVCPDDINRLDERKTVENALKENYGGEFNLGGLGAYPIAGLSGMIAASHHLPDDIKSEKRKAGNLLFYVSPHFGILQQRELLYGKIIRPGQKKITDSCGAIMGFLSALKTSGSSKTFIVPPDADYLDISRFVLQTELKSLFSEEIDKLLDITETNLQVAELFKLNYDLVLLKSKVMIDEFLKKESFEGHIGVIGGLTVNLAREDLFILKDLFFPKND
ncbi:MAG: hypothetical protein EU544_01350 [Promethearchaeota archaeon]|nr:MAG: hypothetical protein EU544_01350 [Candidatus Lokiarchaeota archaeon]